MFIAHVLKAVKTWFERQSAEAELSAMTDRSLRDLGIERTEISKVVRFGR